MFFRSTILFLATAATTVLGQGVGQGTYYAPGLGACGIFNTDADAIVAVSTEIFNNFPGATPNPNLNPICGRTISVSYGGKTIQAAITDKCYSCATNDLDFSPSLFTQFAPEAVGRLYGVQWSFN